MIFDPKQLGKPDFRVDKGKKGYAYKRTPVIIWEMPVKGKPYRFLSIGKHHLLEEEMKGMLHYFGFNLEEAYGEETQGLFTQYFQEIKASKRPVKSSPISGAKRPERQRKPTRI